MGLSVVVTGRLWDGIHNVFGPFKTEEEAEEWAALHVDEIDFSVFPLFAADSEE